MTKAVDQNTVTAIRAKAATFNLSPEMARLRLEYLARCARNDAVFDRMEALPDNAPERDSVKCVFDAALGALRDIEYQIFETPILTMADATFVIRLRVKVEGDCSHLPAHRNSEEAAMINALRFLNTMVCDDISAGSSPGDADDWLSQAPYAENQPGYSATAAE